MMWLSSCKKATASCRRSILRSHLQGELSWVHAELAPHYSHLGRPSIQQQT